MVVQVVPLNGTYIITHTIMWADHLGDAHTLGIPEDGIVRSETKFMITWVNRALLKFRKDGTLDPQVSHVTVNDIVVTSTTTFPPR